jgi:hypothetical protein
MNHRQYAFWRHTPITKPSSRLKFEISYVAASTRTLLTGEYRHTTSATVCSVIRRSTISTQALLLLLALQESQRVLFGIDVVEHHILRAAQGSGV